MTATLLSLHSYPVKSCAALNHEQVSISQSGLFLDRHWVVVSESGTFLTQRSHPRMALIQPALQQHDLTLSAPGMPPLHVPWLTDTDTPDPVPVRIWSSNTLGFDEGPEAAHWLSGFLETPCRLLRVHPTAERLASPEHLNAWRVQHGHQAPNLPASHRFGFADGFPFLVAFTASLDQLNHDIAASGHAPVPMNRFRPNLVISGTQAFEEDFLAGLRIGTLTFAFVKACTRCTVPDINQATAERGAEPGLTLAQTRQSHEGTLFGCNAVVAGTHPGSTLATGLDVQLLYA
ncbi:MAG: MOSC domain-containing protein [Alcaligenaceae bacterium]|nr:MOSC domain-containing protein [Alcaligenaceae bacterium]